VSLRVPRETGERLPLSPRRIHARKRSIRPSPFSRLPDRRIAKHIAPNREPMRTAQPNALQPMPSKRYAQQLHISTPRQQSRALPPTLLRPRHGSCAWRRVEGSAAARPLLRSSWRLGECSSQPARLVHSSLAFAVPCQAEALGVPSIAVCCFFRVSKPADALSLQHVAGAALPPTPTHRSGSGALERSLLSLSAARRSAAGQHSPKSLCRPLHAGPLRLV